MPEIERTTMSGETSQRFIEFVMMQAQHAAMFLGQIPHPQTGRGEVNLEMARLLIDQLEMIREKTRGNLSTEESQILTKALSNLQMAYVEIAARMGEPDAFSRRPMQAPKEEKAPEKVSEKPAAAKPEGAQKEPGVSAEEESESAESKLKFRKSYGA